MSSTIGYNGYASRSMNGITTLTDSQGNSLDEIAQKVTNISYDQITDTTTIIDNTQLQIVKLDSITFADGSTMSTVPAGFGVDVSFARVDVSLNLTTPQITFGDGSIQSTAYLGGGGGYPIDASFSTVDVSNNLTTRQLTFYDGTFMTTKPVPYVLPTDVSFANVDVSNNINTKRVTFADNTYLTTASIPLPTDPSFNSITVTTDISCANLYASNDVTAVNYGHFGNVWCEGQWVNTNNTATNVIGFPYQPNVYSFQYISGTPEIGDFVKPSQPNMPTGIESNFYVTAYDPSGTITFNSNNMSNSAQLYATVDGYCPKNNELWSYDFSAGLISLGSGIISNSITSSIKPFVQSYDPYFNSYFVSTPNTNLTPSGSSTLSGYFKNATTIVTNDTYIANRYLTASTNIVPPTRVVSQSGKLVTIQSKNTITPSVSSGVINGVITSPTTISYVSNTASIGDFLGSSQPDGVTISSIDLSNQIITVANGTLNPTPSARTTIYGYVSSGSVVQTYDTTTANIGDHIVGLGVASPLNIISSKTSTALTMLKTNATVASPVNTFSGYVDTNRIITNGTINANLNFVTNAGLPVPTRITNKTGVYVNITSPSAITNTTKTAFSAVSYGGNKLAYQTASPVVGYFVSSNNSFYDVSDGTIMSVVDTTATQQIITLSTSVPTNQPQFQHYGYIPANNKICLTSNANVLVNRYLFDPSGITIPFGRNYISYVDGSGCIIYNNTLTPTPSAGTFYGYVKTGGTTTAVLVTNDSFATGSVQFVTGAGFAGTGYNGSSGTGVLRNLTCAGTNTATATTSTTFTGFVYDSSNINYVSVSSSGIGAFYQGTGIPEGQQQQIATDTTNQKITVNGNLTPQSTADFTRSGYGLSSNTIQLYDTTSLAVNQFIKSAYTSSNKPYITAINTTTKVLTLSTGTVTPSSITQSVWSYITSATSPVTLVNSGWSGSIVGNFIVNGTLSPPNIVGAYDSVNNVYALTTPNTNTATPVLYSGYACVLPVQGYTYIITNISTFVTNPFIECTALFGLGSSGVGVAGGYDWNAVTNSKNTYSTTTTITTGGAFYNNMFYFDTTLYTAAAGAMIYNATNAYTKHIFLTTISTGSAWNYSNSSAITNATTRLTSNAVWVIVSANQFAYQTGTSTTVAVNDFITSGNAINGARVTTVGSFRVITVNRNFAGGAPASNSNGITVGAGTNATRIFISGYSTNPVVGQFVKVTGNGTTILGVRITAVNLITSPYIDVDTALTWTTGQAWSSYNATAVDLNCIVGIDFTSVATSPVKLINGVNYDTYAPSNISIYNPITITNWAPTTFTKYNSSIISITTPAVYQSIVPQNYNEITSSPYSLYDVSGINTFTPVSIKMWNNQPIYFYNPQTINLYRDNRITFPQQTDTVCLLDSVQSIKNKSINTSTINTSTINTPVINTPNINGFITSQNNSGVAENFLQGRDASNNTILNYGSSFNLRNNSSNPALYINSSLNSTFFGTVTMDSGLVQGGQNQIFKSGTFTTPSTGNASGTVTFTTAFPSGYTVTVTSNANRASGDTNMVTVTIFSPSTTGFGYNVLYKDGRNGQTGGGWLNSNLCYWIAIGYK